MIVKNWVLTLVCEDFEQVNTHSKRLLLERTDLLFWRICSVPFKQLRILYITHTLLLDAVELRFNNWFNCSIIDNRPIIFFFKHILLDAFNTLTHKKHLKKTIRLRQNILRNFNKKNYIFIYPHDDLNFKIQICYYSSLEVLLH